MELVKQRRTRRPSVIWLDDQMALMLDQVGHLNVRGFDVQPTDSITAFLAALRGQRVNIAIIDIKLGGSEDGRALVNLLYDSHPDMGIVVHSSYPGDFLSSNYDPGRVIFVEKDATNEPLEIDDAWPLAEALRHLVASLNARRAGLTPDPGGIVLRENKRPKLTWGTVQRFRETAMDHIILAVIVGSLALKMFLLDTSGALSVEMIKEYAIEVAGFVVPFLLAIVLAWKFTPERIREGSTSEKFVQAYFEEAASDDDFRAEINGVLSRSGAEIPPDDFPALVKYYDVLVTRRLWLARVVLALFAVGIVYLIFDIGKDIVATILRAR